MHNTWTYIFIMVLTTFIIRALPLMLIRKEITNPFLKSFLYYVPYVTLAVMTFPAIIEATNSPIAGAISLVVGIIVSIKGMKLMGVASMCVITVLIVELFI